MPHKTIISIAFFVSGAAALLYQAAWIRIASLTFGSTTLAVSTTVAVFFLGLAAGSEVFGRLAARSVKPLRIFAFLQVLVALFAALTPVGFAAADRAYGWLYAAVDYDPLVVALARFVLNGLVILPAAFLMGGALPLMVRHFVGRDTRIPSISGLLYAINTTGAVAGVLIAGFVLIRDLGLNACIALGAVLDVAAGLAVWLLCARHGTAPPRSTGVKAAPHGGRLIAFLYFVTGFVALANEVLWTRYLGLLVHNTVHTFTLVLAVVLIGIVAGALLSAWLSRSYVIFLQRPGLVFGTTQIALGLVVIATAALPPELWARLGTSPLVYVLVLFPSAALSGAAFPLAMRLAVQDPELAATGAGRLTAANTAGAVAGSIIAGFVLLPFLGLQAALVISSGISVLCGLIAWAFIDERRAVGQRMAIAMTCGLAWALLPRWTQTRLPADFLAPPEQLVDYREGLTGNVAVTRRGSVLQLEIDRWWQGSSRRGHQAVAAHVPMLLHPAARDIMVVGVGAGQTPATFLMYDIDSLDCVDIEPAVFSLLGKHFDADWMSDPRVSLVDKDGRNHLHHADTRYDVISIEAGQFFRPGVATFYTAEFYAQARQRLAPGGVLAQFVPIAFFTVEEFRTIIATFVAEFPASVLWYNTAELLLVGFERSDAALPSPRLDLLSRNAAVNRDLAHSHWGGPAHWLNVPEVWLAGFLAGPAALARMTEGADIYSDNRPYLEYRIVGPDEQRSGEADIVELLRRELSSYDELSLPVDIEIDQVRRLREINLQDVLAAAAIRRSGPLLASGDRGQAAQRLREAVAINPLNVRALQLLGDLHVAQRQWADAEAPLQRALEVAPDHKASLRSLAFVLLNQQRLSDAITSYRKYLALSPDDSQAHNNLGTALIRQGDPWSAQHHFEEALRLAPEFTEAKRNLAQARTITSRPLLTPGSN